MKRYIIINEEEQAVQCDSVGQQTLDSYEEMYLTIIDLELGKTYHGQGEWKYIPEGTPEECA